MADSPPTSSRGLPAALGAYMIWGLLPLYIHLVRDVPAFEFVGWRVVFTLPFCLLLVVVARHVSELRAALANRHHLAMLLLSAMLIGGNWLIYIAAVQNGHFLAASLGYYINPLFNVLLGTLFLGERLSRLQWLAVGIAALAVSLLAWEARDMLVISLSLAATFSGYGLVRRHVPVSSLAGLTVETLLLLFPAVGLIVWHGLSPQGVHFGKGSLNDLLVIAAGIVTAVPLMLFAYAARRLSFSLLGFIQFLAPTIVFITALLVMHEPIRPVQLYSFVLIWIAIGCFIADSLKRQRERVPA